MDYTISTNTTAIGSGDAAPVSGTPGEFTEGNPATSIPATVLPAYQMNALVQEVRNAIVGGGLTPDKTNNAQLLAAMKAIAGGPSQSLLSPGHQEFEGGLIVQWGNETFTTGTKITYSMPFPNNELIILPFVFGGGVITGYSTNDATGFTPTLSSGSGSGGAYIAIGH